jgi:DtxR family manganese transport transcriptional regulator
MIVAPARDVPYPAAQEHAMPRRSLPAASAHARTRRDHASETAEDYAEAVADLIDAAGVCRVTDLAARFAVSHVTVVRTVQRLAREGYLATAPYQPVTLTPRGRRLAAHCRARHDTVYRFLLALGLPPRTAAIDAEGIEHHLSPATLARFRQIADAGFPLDTPTDAPADPPAARPKAPARTRRRADP